MEDLTKNYPVNAFRICVDKIEPDISGRVFSPLCEEAILFSGIDELLIKADNLFDEVGYPQAFQVKRSFGQEKEKNNCYRGIPQGKSEAGWITAQTGKRGTYDVLVESRRNTSWQGKMYHQENCREINFDGEMELLQELLRDSVGGE